MPAGGENADPNDHRHRAAEEVLPPGNGNEPIQGQGDDADGDDTVASASTIQSGTRVGRKVALSTQACDVQPSAIVSPSRVIV